ncbi:hypothetical protein D3C87_2075930 [compost metagenome]
MWSSRAVIVAVKVPDLDGMPLSVTALGSKTSASRGRYGLTASMVCPVVEST